MNQALLCKILRSPRLPTLPTVALDVIELVQKKNVDIKQIANTIQLDPALASKILKTVNSSFYGQAYSISTISHALVVLGLNSVKSLALGFSLVANLKDHTSEGFDHVAFWKRSLYAATAAKSLAQKVNIPQQEEIFLGGLLHDLGMLAMSQTLGSPYAKLLREAGDNHDQLAAIERQRFDMDHAQVGGALAESWNLPPLLVAPILYHEQPDDAPPPVQPLVRCISLGIDLADVFVNPNSNASLQRFCTNSRSWFKLDQSRAEPLLREIHAQTRTMHRLFELPDSEMEHPDAILARANEALELLTLQSHQQTHELRQANEKLSHQVNTDPLTGAANRGRFNCAIVEAFLAASDRPLSLLFLDVDHFKSFNDTYGHPTGDRVLVEVVNTLRNTLPDHALIARYGGEEFAVILESCDRRGAAKMADKARLAIEAMSVSCDQGKPLHVTASIGVATHEGGFFGNVEQFIKTADQGVYAAKHAGRNCVRIFTPRTKAAA
ncbi:MAG: HDOD domain-containing protein [Phycisphaeraceae bacterium]|nr:HDOD domain-containing protein [Phycisphaeraceae bacterium]